MNDYTNNILKYLPATFSILFLFTTLITPLAHTQAQLTQPDSLSISLDPLTPSANTEVTATAESSVVDIMRSEISWYINGTQQKKGIGEKKFTFNTGNSGGVTKIDVVVSANGRTLKQSVTIRPLSIDLLWQAHTYTPPFFKGKALYTTNSVITYVAVPSLVTGGVSVNPKTLTYIWRKDGKIIPDGSGYGKQSLTIPDSPISRPYTISVEASSASGIKGYAFTRLIPTNPELLQYENNPLYGIQYQNALNGEEEHSGDEISVRSYPLFFSTGTRKTANLLYTWDVNKQLINDTTYSSDIIIRKNEKGSARSTIETTVTHAVKLFQASANKFSLTFSNQGDDSTF